MVPIGNLPQTTLVAAKQGRHLAVVDCQSAVPFAVAASVQLLPWTLYPCNRWRVPFSQREKHPCHKLNHLFFIHLRYKVLRVVESRPSEMVSIAFLLLPLKGDLIWLNYCLWLQKLGKLSSGWDKLLKPFHYWRNAHNIGIDSTLGAHIVVNGHLGACALHR